MGMMSREGTCRVGFVGAGYMSREHARAFADVPGVELAGICSRTRTRAEQLAAETGIRGVYGSIDEMREATRADLVVVSVPELSMRDCSSAAFRHDWTVLLEKPAGHTIEDARAIAKAAAQRKAGTYVALNRRFYDATRAARNDLATGNDPRFIVVQDQQDQAAALAAGQPEDVVRHWMFANSIHTIDYLRVFGRGAVTSVRPIVPWEPSRPSIVVADVRFESGDIGLYQGVWNGPGPWAVAISTPAARWELRPLESAAVQRRGERRLTPVETHPRDVEFKAGLRLQAEHAVAAAMGRPNESVSIAVALESMELVHRIFAPGDAATR